MFIRLSRPAFIMAAALTLAGCQTRVTDISAPAPVLATAIPAPSRVLVYGFTLNPALIRQAQGRMAERQRAGQSAQANAAQRRAVAQDVQDAITETLVAEIQKMGLPAQRAAPGMQPMMGDLVIAGEITSVDEGNRARRVAIGLGVGESEVRATVTVSLFQQQNTALRLKTFEAEANSGKAPGMAESLGIGAASGTALSAAAVGTVGEVRMERKRNPVAQEGERLARRLSVNLGGLFAEQGWIDKDKVPSRFRAR